MYSLAAARGEPGANSDAVRNGMAGSDLRKAFGAH
jgi:hypothetical protein